MKRSKIKESALIFGFVIMFLSIISFKIATAAQWAKTYLGTGDDSANVIKQTADGGYIVTGYTGHPYTNPAVPMFGPPPLITDFWVLKLGAAGEIIWQKIYGGQSSDQATSVQEAADGGYIVAGTTASFGAGQYIWILKLDPDGNMNWQKTYGGDGPGIIRQTLDGGYIVLGSSYSSGGGTLVLKLDGDGNIQWQKAYGGAYPWSIQQTSDGGYILVGRMGEFLNGDIWVSKLDKNGNVQGQKSYRGSGNAWGNSIQQTSDGGYIVAGGAHFSDAGDSDVLVFKLNWDGTVAWQKTYGGPAEDWASSIEQTSDGGYVVVGTTYSFGAGNDDIWAFKLNYMGDIEWQMTYGSPGFEWGNSIQQTTDGGYIVAGGGPKGFFVLRLDNNGDIPGCSVVGTSNATVKDTNIIGADTSVTGTDTAIVPLTSNATALATNTRENKLCFSSSPPGVTVQPTQLDYGRILIEGSSDRTVSVTNNRDKNLNIVAVTSPSAPFFISGDQCTNQTLSPGSNCTFTIRFSPTSPGDFSESINVIINDPDGGEVPISMSGVGALITLSTPLNNTPFDAISLNSPPTFSWGARGGFISYEIQFSPYQNFLSISTKVKTSTTTTLINSRTWKKILLIQPSTPRGLVYWRVVGTKADKTTATSGEQSIIVEPQQAVGNPTISNTQIRSLPTLAWENRYNIKFKVSFGSDTSLSEKKSFTFNIKNPTDNGGEFSKILTQSQWMTIKRLVKNATGSSIYWYIESWDGLGRYTKTDVTSFELTE
jgi:hypothetical protein